MKMEMELRKASVDNVEVTSIVDDLKLELGWDAEPEKQALAERLVKKAVRKIVDFTNQPTEYVVLTLPDYCVDVAIIIFNRMGTEGTTNQSNSGASEGYLNELPKDLKSYLSGHRRLRK